MQIKPILIALSTIAAILAVWADPVDYVTPSSERTVWGTTDNWSPENIYVDQLYLNGQLHDKSYFTYDDIRDGATLHFVMSKTPNHERATSSEAVPPSISTATETALYSPHRP